MIFGKDNPFRILNVLDIVGASMGLRRNDEYKRLKLLQDVEAIANDCRDIAVHHGLDTETTRKVIVAMLADQPVPLGERR
jgi:heterodisulfide reductase subunit D